MTDESPASPLLAAEPKSSLRNATRESFEYLVTTLSKRTAGKKYENYVVNAIWNALGDETLRPVTQQYVNRSIRHRGLALVDLKQDRAKGETARRALIDLYFPALRLGVEIDEAHHHDTLTVDADAARTEDIKRAIPDYEELRVRVELDENNIAMSPNGVLDQIDEAVRSIRQRKIQVERGDFSWAGSGPVVWRNETPDWKLALEAGELRAGDGLAFRTNGEIRELFGLGADGVKTNKYGEVISPGGATNHFRANFELPDSEYVVWCPTLATQAAEGPLQSTNSRGFLNWILVESDDVLIGQADSKSRTRPWNYAVPEEEMIRRSRTDDWEPPMSADLDSDPWKVRQRITFVRTKDAVGRTRYQFLGVFTPTIGYREFEGISFAVCRLVSDTILLPTPQRLGAGI